MCKFEGDRTTVNPYIPYISVRWWRHQMETFSALLALCAGNSPVPVNSPHKASITRSFDVFFDLRLNKLLSKQPWGWWFEMLSWSLWLQCNGDVLQRPWVVFILCYQCYSTESSKQPQCARTRPELTEAASAMFWSFSGTFWFIFQSLHHTIKLLL